MVEREFKEELLVEDLIKVGLTPMDMQKIGEDWETMIKILNAMLIKGPKVTSKISLKELTKMQEKVGKSFLE